jgi:hypothetical protein
MASFSSGLLVHAVVTSSKRDEATPLTLDFDDQPIVGFSGQERLPFGDGRDEAPHRMPR